MGLPAKLVRAQLNFFKPFVANCSLEITRKGQDKLGELMEAIHRRDVIVRDHDFGPFQGAWIMPKDERRQGVVLYHYNIEKLKNRHYCLPMYTGLDTDSSYGTNHLGTSSYHYLANHS